MTGFESCVSPVAVAGVLQDCVGGLMSGGPGTWSFPLPGERDRRAVVRLDDEWLLFDLPLNSGESPPYAQTDWLAANVSMPAPCKWVLAPCDRSLRLRAEHPLLEQDVAPTIHCLCARFLKAAGGRECAPVVLGDQPVQVETFRQSCTEGGWLLNEHRGGRLSVSLEVPEALFQADVYSVSGEEVLLFVELVRCEGLLPASVRALNALLLLTTGQVRMVRAVGRGNEGRRVLGLEAWLPAPPGSAEVAHALSALSIACGACGGAMDVFQDESLARQYLECQGLAL